MIAELVVLTVGIISGISIVAIIWIISDWLHIRREWKRLK